MRRPVVLALAIPIAASVLACSGTPKDTQGPGAQGGGGGAPAAKSHAIVLEVSGPKSADITYSTGADQSQDNGAALPWKKELVSQQTLIIATVTAQSKGAKGDITCRITIDGKVVKENKSSGQFAVVTCSSS